MLKIRRIKTDKFKTAAFWIEKRDNEYIACRTLVNALLGIASPVSYTHLDVYKRQVRLLIVALVGRYPANQLIRRELI